MGAMFLLSKNIWNVFFVSYARKEAAHHTNSEGFNCMRAATLGRLPCVRNKEHVPWNTYLGV